MAKRLFAVGTGVIMLGATAMGAMAVDLKTYPDFFVKDGVFDGYMVVGEASAAQDNMAMTDIAASMKYNKVGDATTTTVEGDNWKVGTSAKKLEMANSNASTVAGENFNAVTSYIGEDELNALQGGTYATGDNEYDYEQFLYFDSADTQNEIVKYSENDADTTADFLYVKNAAQIAKYKLGFTSQAQSDVTDADGTVVSTGAYLDDFENTQITMLGKALDVVMARRVSSAKEDSVKLVLMTGSTRDTITEGEEKTYTLEGKDYKVKAIYTDLDEVKFTVNGEATDKLKVGESKKLSDGREIGVSEILYQDYAGGVHSATFFLGANKMELRDDEIQDDTVSDHDLIVGTTEIDGAHVIIKGTDDNSTVKLTSIEINMTADDDYWVPANGKLSSVIAANADEEEVLFTQNWDVEYMGLTTEDTHSIKLDTSGDRRYVLSFYDGGNNKVDMPLAYAVAQYNLSMGEEASSKALVLAETTAIAKDDYFVITGGTAAGDKKSFVLQYKGADDLDKSSPKLKFKNLGNGETLEYSAATTDPRATLNLGGYSFDVKNASDTALADDWTIFVEMNDDGDTLEGTNVLIEDYFGAQFTVALGGLGNSTTEDQLNVTIETPNTDDYDTEAPMPLVLRVTSDNNIEVSSSLGAPSGTTNSLLKPEGESDVAYGYTTMGGKVTWKTPSSAPETLEYGYPKSQVLPQVYVTSGAVTSTSSAGGVATAVAVVDATKLDSEIADATAQNLLVIGGPCVNSVAASLLGNPATCTEGFTAGKARIKLFENSGKVAMLVAGYTGEDTRTAGRIVANTPEKLTALGGMEVEIETATSTVSTPTVVEVAPAEEVPAEVPAEETTQ